MDEFSESHTIRHRVTYAETDQMGIVHHAEYLIWLERGRIELLRSLGVRYRDLEASGVAMPVREAHLKFLRSIRFDDEIEITTRLVEVGRATCRFHSAVRQMSDALVSAEGEVLLAFCDPQGKVIRGGPERLRQMIETRQHAKLQYPAPESHS